MMSPAAFPRRVLFTVTGLTPQIVTETVYALAVRQTPAFVPTQLLVMTTSDGANRVRLTLQGSEPGWLARLCKDYALPPIGFAADDLRVLRDAGGGALADIRTGADNEAAANAIIETIRTLTADPGCALHVSLAGGRKTLGFFAAYALSLYGRPQDRLSHVLVSPEFESSTDFYYPTPYHQVIYTRDRTPLDTRDAVVELADIPFVRMRDGLPEALRAGQASYGQAVAAVQDRLRPAALVIDLRQGRVMAGGQAVSLRPLSLAFYTWIARNALAGRRIDKTAKQNPARDMAQARAFLAEYGGLVDLAEHATIHATMRDGLQYEFFSQNRSKLNRVLRRAIEDAAAAGPYLVQQFGRRARGEYGLALPSEAISIIEA
nr:CRISPR-associated ring nuclease Csm6 [uncultured Rhodopila sp.]